MPCPRCLEQSNQADGNRLLHYVQEALRLKEGLKMEIQTCVLKTKEGVEFGRVEITPSSTEGMMDFVFKGKLPPRPAQELYMCLMVAMLDFQEAYDRWLKDNKLQDVRYHFGIETVKK